MCRSCHYVGSGISNEWNGRLRVYNYLIPRGNLSWHNTCRYKCIQRSCGQSGQTSSTTVESTTFYKRLDEQSSQCFNDHQYRYSISINLQKSQQAISKLISATGTSPIAPHWHCWSPPHAPLVPPHTHDLLCLVHSAASQPNSWVNLGISCKYFIIFRPPWKLILSFWKGIPWGWDLPTKFHDSLWKCCLNSQAWICSASDPVAETLSSGVNEWTNPYMYIYTFSRDPGVLWLEPDVFQTKFIDIYISISFSMMDIRIA